MTRIYRPPTRHLFSDAARERRRREIVLFIVGCLAVLALLLGIVFLIAAQEAGLPAAVVIERTVTSIVLLVVGVAFLVASVLSPT